MKQNTFCSKCHRIPNQCCCNTAPRELSDEQKDEIIVEYMGEQHKGDYVLRHMIGAILKKASEK
jgi:hypothetical protein